MDDLREKVIKGLEMHASGMCNVVTSSNGREYCPYWENNDNCMVELLKDALSLLKSQEPRVLQIKEMAFLEIAVFIETNGDLEGKGDDLFLAIPYIYAVSQNMLGG